MIARIRDLFANQAGTTAVEFAFVVGPLVLLLMGGIEFGRMVYTRQALSETAIATARCIKIGQAGCTSGGSYSASASRDYARAQASRWFVALQTSEVVVDDDTTCGGVSGFAAVTITHDFQTALPFIGDLANLTTLQTSACF
jgi:Flp pilus assembly protein TadG